MAVVINLGCTEKKKKKNHLWSSVEDSGEGGAGKYFNILT